MSHRGPMTIRRLLIGLWPIVAAFGISILSGCAALTNPVADGVPVRRLPPDLLAQPKEGEHALPLSLLRQKPPEQYRLDAGDVLGIWIEGILGERNQLPPVHFPDTGTGILALGYPIPVRTDGTLPLPLVDPVPVRGMTVEEAQAAVIDSYTVKKKILQPGRERVIVTLLRRRVFQVLVFREDAGAGLQPAASAVAGTRSVAIALGTGNTVGSPKRSAGFAVDLPAGENDVLHALALTGGLPGLDAVNEVVIQRGYFQGGQERAALFRDLEVLAPGCGVGSTLTARGGHVVRIPLRYRPGEIPSVRPEDIVLQTGDIVYIEAREAELYYTAGLLPPGQHILPRDYDLDVVQAIALVGGPLVSGGLNPINLAGSFLTNGIGAASPSMVTVVRRTPSGGQVAIHVDLNRALRDPRERILLKPQDLIVLQETPAETVSRYFTNVFKFNLIWNVIHGPHETGSTNLAVP